MNRRYGKNWWVKNKHVPLSRRDAKRARAERFKMREHIREMIEVCYSLSMGVEKENYSGGDSWTFYAFNIAGKIQYAEEVLGKHIYDKIHSATTNELRHTCMLLQSRYNEERRNYSNRSYKRKLKNTFIALGLLAIAYCGYHWIN